MKWKESYLHLSQFLKFLLKKTKDDIRTFLQNMLFQNIQTEIDG